MRIPGKLCLEAVVGIFFALTVFGVGGCERIPEGEKGYSPATLTYSQAKAAASVAQSEHPGCILLQAMGTSMLPKYGNNTIFVIKPIAWADLKVGMDVAYVRPTGDTVVHRLVGSGGDFWIVQGINNSVPDEYHVTPENLIGQVWTAFSYDRPEDSDAQ
jgi:hypothetical protein